tara:strand:- start:606 stop:851 length:246 start_codon:yes stop_codon:yes gene_type:complete
MAYRFYKGDLVKVVGHEIEGMGIVLDCIVGVCDFTDDYYFVAWIIMPSNIGEDRKGWFSQPYLQRIKKDQKKSLQNQIDLV